VVETYERHIGLESVINFRDLGGYRTRKGKTVVWRRIFRSGEFSHLVNSDLQRLKKEIVLTSVLDLRSKFEIERQGTGLLAETGIKYHNVALITNGGDPRFNEQMYKEISSMGEFYLFLVRQKEFGRRIVYALEIIAAPVNHPLVFNCAVGKDRTGILAAMLLGVLGVGDEDIIEDYSLSGPYMEEILKKIERHPKKKGDPGVLPDFFWKAPPESIELFLTTLRKDYGSITGYLESMGMEPSLVGRLERALLI
jgi:protein-tyrosine phosphatase